MVITSQLARALAQARVTNRRVVLSSLGAGFDEEVKKLTIPQGYEVMTETARVLQKEHEFNIAGYKVGATSKTVQQRLGLSTPFWGMIFNTAKVTAQSRNGNIPRFSIHGDLIRGVEAEIAFTIKKDIVPRPEKKYTAEELIRDYCATVIPCVEVCGFRLPQELGSIGSMVIADTGNTAVVFPNEVFAKDLKDVKMSDLIEAKASVSLDGVRVAEGSGADVLGSPALALEWFVQEACNGPAQITINQGSFVTTGATCGLVPVTKSCYMLASFTELSKCDIHIAFRE